MAFSDRLRSLRINRDLTQEQLAVRVGVSRVSIGYYERGRIPPANTLQRLADVLGVAEGYLLNGSAGDSGDDSRWDNVCSELECAGYQIEPLENDRFIISWDENKIVIGGNELQSLVESIAAAAEEKRSKYFKNRLAAEFSVYDDPEILCGNPTIEKY